MVRNTERKTEMKLIIGMATCHQCHDMHEQHPDWAYVELDPKELVKIGKAIGQSSLPFVFEY